MAGGYLASTSIQIAAHEWFYAEETPVQIATALLEESKRIRQRVQEAGDPWICLLNDKSPTSIAIKLMSKEEAEELAEVLHRAGDQVRICTMRTTRDFTVFENIRNYPHDPLNLQQKNSDKS